MQFNLLSIATLAAALVAAAPGALAATCYSQSGCPRCETQESMEDARVAFCPSFDHSSSTTWGLGRITLNGRFFSEQECLDGFENIIEQCYGHRDGGHYSYDFNGDSATLDVDFCDCE
ncbi:hypothetical protein BC628DRAFT_1342476 [Trametes gibbosa]|nr:hypothetical protein BC628DRAFT_1342476 [Trametes gibbosa]